MTDLNTILLQLAVFIPLICGVLLFLGKRLEMNVAKSIALSGFLSPAVIALWLWSEFGAADKGAGGYAFASSLDTGLQDAFGIALHLGLNGIALPMFVLAGIVGAAAGLHALQSRAERLVTYLQLLLFMLGGLMGVFASVDIFFFYFFHELALIPTFIMIGIWGGQGRRVAAMELTIYLTLGAMLSLIGLIALYAAGGWAAGAGFNLIELKKQLVAVDANTQAQIFGLLLIGFGILVSLFPFHSWAPRGYAAAPTSAAMLHAGVLKKFGLYGLIQIAAPLLPKGVEAWSSLIIWLALGNLVLLGLVTMAQRDLKQLIGYSSVMHMGYCFLGIVTMSVIGIGGAVLLMFAHGLSVALMFMLATSVYNRTRTYDLTAMGGLGKKAPVLAAIFVAGTMASIGLPGFANFWGEFTIFVALWEQHSWAVAPAVAAVVISAIYGLRAVAQIFYGPPTQALSAVDETSPITDITFSEKLPAAILLVALLAVGIWPKSVTEPLNHELVNQVVFKNPVVEKPADALAQTEPSNVSDPRIPSS